MAVHDWTRVEPGIFHAFHTAWVAELQSSLNKGLLPSGYYALAEQHAGRAIADVLTLHASPGSEEPLPLLPDTGGIALTEAPPKVRHKQVLDPTAMSRQRTLAIRHVSGHRLVALLEIVSPANKDRSSHLDTFVGKIASALEAGIHVLLLDLFPPGTHDTNGLHNCVLEGLGHDNASYDLPQDEPLTLASYLAGPRIEAYLEHVASGAKLPTMPLFLLPFPVIGEKCLSGLTNEKRVQLIQLLRFHLHVTFGFEKSIAGASMADLKILTGPCELDFLALGALVHRLDPGVIPFRKARSLEIHVSGGEYNVAANLSDCFRLRTGIATAMVNYGIGELIQTRVREMGVTPIYKWFEHDGVRGPNLATVYSDRGHGVRAPVVFYNRANEAAALLQPGDFDWGKIFAKGVRWFHSGGIFAALSETTSELITEGMQAAKASGAVVSFDLNYRPKLWSTFGAPEHAQQVLTRIADKVDALIGNEEDLQKGLGIAGPDVGSRSNLDPDTFFLMIDRVVEQHPNIKLVATTLREVHSTNRHEWGAVLWLNGQRYVSPTCHLDVSDRIGGGDGFASGLIYGLLSGRQPEEALRLGWAHGAFLTTYPGDVTMAKLEEVEAFAKGGSARVQR